MKAIGAAFAHSSTHHHRSGPVAEADERDLEAIGYVLVSGERTVGTVMIDVESTLEISRPVDEVFAFVADQTNAPKWQNGLREVRRLTDGPIGVGSQHEFVRRFAGREMASRNRFVAFEAGRYVRFEIPEGWLTGHASYMTEPSASGTVLTSRMNFHARGLGALLEPLLSWVLARDSRRDEQRLKLLLESGATPEGA